MALKQHTVIRNLVKVIVLRLKAQCAEVSMYAGFPSITSTLLSTAQQGPQTNYSFVRGEQVSRMHYHLAPWRGHLCLQRCRRESARDHKIRLRHSFHTTKICLSCLTGGTETPWPTNCLMSESKCIELLPVVQVTQ